MIPVSYTHLERSRAGRRPAALRGRPRLARRGLFPGKTLRPLRRHGTAHQMCIRDSLWDARLRPFGEALGRFIYLLDAVIDLPEDLRHGRYNPCLLYTSRCV